jgi:hypothetical protein
MPPDGKVRCMPTAHEGAVEESSSFLKKRTKKLLFFRFVGRGMTRTFLNCCASDPLAGPFLPWVRPAGSHRIQEGWPHD